MSGSNATSINKVDFSKDQVHVRGTVERNGNFTIAEVRVLTLSPTKEDDFQLFTATGASVKNNMDKESPVIGGNIAIARALRKLSQRIMNETMALVHARCSEKMQNPLRHVDDETLHMAYKESRRELERRKKVRNHKEKIHQDYVKAAKEAKEKEYSLTTTPPMGEQLNISTYGNTRSEGE